MSTVGERRRVVVERPLPTRSCGKARNDGRVAGFHHEDGGITASLEHRLVTFEDFRFGKRVGAFDPASMELPDAICWVTEAISRAVEALPVTAALSTPTKARSTSRLISFSAFPSWYCVRESLRSNRTVSL